MAEYVLHARERELLYYLSSMHRIVTAKEISAKLAISERTIRSDITRINQTLDGTGICIRSVYGKGYQLEILDRAVFQRLFSDEKNIQTKEDRIRYLILRLVRSEGDCDLMDLEEDIYISRTTLENDLKEVQARITENQPFLEMRRKGNVIRVEENELKRRNILIRLYSMAWDYDSRDGITLKDSVMEKRILDQIRVEMKNILEQYQIELDDFGLIYLTIALAVCYARALDGRELILPEDWKENALAAKEKKYKAASHMLLDRMEGLWEVAIERDVYRWLPSTICQLAILRLGDITPGEVKLFTDDSCAEIENALLDRLEAEYGLFLREDESFCTHLLLHIQALRNGMVSMQMQNRYVLDYLQGQYPYLGEIAYRMRRYLERTCKLRLGAEGENDLIPLLAMAQTNWLIRQREEKMRMSVVSHYNSGLTHYLMNELERKYGTRIKLDGPFPVYDRNRMDAAKPACILTTVQMDVFRRFDVPVITVSAQPTRSEQEKIEYQIRKMEENCLYPGLPRERSHYFRSELTVKIVGKKKLPEILGYLGQRLMEYGYLWKKQEIPPEGDYATVLSNGMLFAYILGTPENDSVFSMAYLDTAISWKAQKGIRRVLLLLLDPAQRKYLGSFYQLAKEIAEREA